MEKINTPPAPKANTQTNSSNTTDTSNITQVLNPDTSSNNNTTTYNQSPIIITTTSLDYRIIETQAYNFAKEGNVTKAHETAQQHKEFRNSIYANCYYTLQSIPENGPELAKDFLDLVEATYHQGAYDKFQDYLDRQENIYKNNTTSSNTSNNSSNTLLTTLPTSITETPKPTELELYDEADKARKVIHLVIVLFITLYYHYILNKPKTLP